MEISEYIQSYEKPLVDSIYGDGFRCSAYLRDGLFLPCVIIRKNQKYIDLACRRLEDEKSGRSIFENRKSGYRDSVKVFVTAGNKVNDYDIKTVEKSRFAMPESLLSRIEGETVMSWTAFVLEMKDRKMFSFGTSFLFAFFDLPDGYSFEDVIDVHNHSYVTSGGDLVSINGTDDFQREYKPELVYRERPYFECYID